MNVLIDTKAREIGELAAEAISDIIERATAGTSITAYAEGESPLSWNALEEGGWDLVGILDDGEGAQLRDIVAIAQVWGTRLIPLPYLETVMAKRHSEIARSWDGPVSFALPTSTLGPGKQRYIPFGQFAGLRVVTALGGDSGQLIEIPEGRPAGLDLCARGVEVDVILTDFSETAARELAVVYAASSVGAARRMLELGVTFAKERQQFGRPIGSFQAVKHHLADALIAVEEADTAVIRASRTTEGVRQTTEFVVKRCIDAAELVLQVHGALGFTWEMGLHYYLRHMLTAQEIVGGLRNCP
ncbi:acyl-CoA dehydrogenase family protein [Paenarthrobacter aromaticivorans]|uniref:Acyl-CoA dehydrogenase/oxidase C-terminal domain-containing protein n=1 Tax=Paenarthrobacter aromaticivorans TaxID=2849150 RepID=A0ABS6I1J6_9MICC|nr:acyl-CoA dehydrogenase family protein [Paenarthrobacter sp. MMS21-TAE1-1]MBU8865608.1 hypothetical protein [Paenarthrobacter sp. MMS21-TAE1-1]